ncbi:hypothetical protein BRE01_62980 [Brevibacillus reuszeri]|uniref:Transglutaminase-like domain-containing protein n=1 Tax=Brevibacillus reuszeri TaxID=54915 RepID=A0ABQ0TXP0_9BACL|nr:transglutaminase-like domain-containing protein [Brevibacillus reuszeri]GED72596.1 hypothetical protein BRE01_62980 [Brevibacillus reuszeri]
MIDQLRDYGGAFRKAIQTMPLSEFPRSSFFERFPRGCCGDTSTLFSKFLQSKGIETHYVWGMWGEYSHAWLELDDILIDLTADQFDGVTEEVMVTSNRQWHSRFTVHNKKKIDFDNFNEYNATRLRAIYNNIIKRMK